MIELTPRSFRSSLYTSYSVIQQANQGDSIYMFDLEIQDQLLRSDNLF